ncbi:brassinosteroid-responsive RING protein 1-like [Gossypium arboreum]|uniref:RING-type domain-containing protein n=1 Tax=Gossypium arboreum TaxID=29729 RepID=A0ABR0MQG8_GOSAR|nr:brassinosteroid-responsive RING protein 1-like [Gossypium arboreum]KAK5776232.1 hypothetical protein PVK06_044191 [Gossypium arboreum]
MIQIFNSIDFSELLIITPLVYLLTDLKFTVMAIDFIFYRLQKLNQLFQDHDRDYADIDDNNDELRPLPSQVPVPFMAHVVSNLIKAKLPVVEFSRWRLRGDIDDPLVDCAICLACVEGSDEIRELGNCSHLYHRECIDGWVDQGHETCPLCWLKLLPCEAAAAADEGGEVKGVYDPWRLERMAYLFGEDY